MDADAKKRQSLKDELLRDLEALERVERLMAARNGSPSVPPDDRQRVLPLNVEGSDTLHIEDDSEGPQITLRGAMESIIKSGGPAYKWTNQKMLGHLKTMNFPLRAKQPIYSVGQTMQKIEESGLIRITRRGAGNQPHIYKLKSVADATVGPSVQEESTTNHAVI